MIAVACLVLIWTFILGAAIGGAAAVVVFGQELDEAEDRAARAEALLEERSHCGLGAVRRLPVMRPFDFDRDAAR